jgi:phosphate transport system substrate-binding protein
MRTLKFTASVLAMAAAATAADARDQLQIAGSSTVLPYATIVAEAFGENFDFPTPVVEGGGSGAGRKKLCEGVGENTIDIANSSSRIKQSDIDLCTQNGVSEIMEVRIGYDGIVFASDVNAGLPAQDIMAFVPGTKHGTREVFDVKVLEEGCKAAGAYDLFLAASAGADDDAKKKDAVAGCTTLRTDGVSVDIDGDYTETLARIDANKSAIGVFGLSFYENNTDKLKVATVDGVVPSVETISGGEYPVSRPLYFYVKKAHIGVIPGLQEYIDFFVSDDMAGPDGVLADYGLVPDPELAATQAAVAAGTPMGPLE